ncbi:4-alpha-glucanotransferase [Butyrivibrio sp. FCS014]
MVYTGTHDNETTRGWFDQLPRNDKKFAKRVFLGLRAARTQYGPA